MQAIYLPHLAPRLKFVHMIVWAKGPQSKPTKMLPCSTIAMAISNIKHLCSRWISNFFDQGDIFKVRLGLP